MQDFILSKLIVLFSYLPHLALLNIPKKEFRGNEQVICRPNKDVYSDVHKLVHSADGLISALLSWNKME